MSNTLTITTTLVNDHWSMTGSMSAGTLPQEIFIYENTGANVLGEYKGVCSLDEISKLQIFTGTTIPIFGNKFVRYGSLSITVPLNIVPTTVVGVILNSLSLLSTAYKSQLNSTQVYTIL